MSIEYRIIEGHPNFIISSVGEIWDKANGTEVRYFKNPIGRKSAVIDGKTYSVDLLVAITFLSNQEGYLLRYRDKDLDNISADNLYWYSPTEEEEREMEREMNEDDFVLGNNSKECYVVNTDGTIRGHYGSVKECAAKTNYQEITISSNIGGYFARIDAYIYHKYDEKTLSDIRSKEKNRNNGCAAYLVGEDGEVIEFIGSVSKKAKEVGQKLSYVTTYIQKRFFCNLLGGYIIPEEEWNEELQQAIKRQSRNKAVLVIGTDGEIKGEHKSKPEMAKHHGVKQNYFYSYSARLSYCEKIDGYVVNAYEWNEDTKEKIRRKESQRRKAAK